MYMSSVHHVFPWVWQHSWANLVSIIVRSMNSVVRRPTRKNVLTRFFVFGKKVSSSLRRMKCKHPSKCFILISWVLNPLYSPTVWWQVQAWGPCKTLSFLGLKEAVLCHLFPVAKERSGWNSATAKWSGFVTTRWSVRSMGSLWLLLITYLGNCPPTPPLNQH